MVHWYRNDKLKEQTQTYLNPWTYKWANNTWMTRRNTLSHNDTHNKCIVAFMHSVRPHRWQPTRQQQQHLCTGTLPHPHWQKHYDSWHHPPPPPHEAPLNSWSLSNQQYRGIDPWTPSMMGSAEKECKAQTRLTQERQMIRMLVQYSSQAPLRIHVDISGEARTSSLPPPPCKRDPPYCCVPFTQTEPQGQSAVALVGGGGCG